ncbi:MAG: sugar transferase, partial [Candidatus Magasanikbacteria bacterium]|nr:sugar transferase [Candidatus Magasanikbacteria bacterium]
TLRAAITTHKAHTVIPAPGFSNHPDTVRELYELLFWPVRIMEFSTFYETITGRVPAASYSDGWFISNLVNRDQQLYDSVRRVIDYAVGIGMGILFIALFPFIAVAIKTNSKGPILFKQKRMGWRSTTFTIQKFRTMYALAADGSAETEGAVFAQKNDDRITKVGTFLRKTRLDELPQFWNLLRGDISLIGPRPERPEIFAKLETAMPYYHLRLLVKPGITGWAAINQHYAGTIDEAIQKLQYDLYYIKNRSALLDLVIVLRTINVVLRMMGQ